MTAATPEARKKARSQRAARIKANPNQLCPPEHKHGLTSTCYNGHGCRCEECRAARAEMKRAEYYGTKELVRADVKVPAIGVQRRLQALAFMGWSCEAVAERIGSHYRPMMRLRAGGRTHVMRSTHDRIDQVFQEWCLQFAPGHSGHVTRGFARRMGFVSPLAWDDIDDPDEVPDVGKRVRRSLDEDVERLWRLRWSDAVIAEELGCSDRTVLRIRARLGLVRWSVSEQERQLAA